MVTSSPISWSHRSTTPMPWSMNKRCPDLCPGVNLNSGEQASPPATEPPRPGGAFHASTASGSRGRTTARADPNSRARLRAGLRGRIICLIHAISRACVEIAILVLWRGVDRRPYTDAWAAAAPHSSGPQTKCYSDIVRQSRAAQQQSASLRSRGVVPLAMRRRLPLQTEMPTSRPSSRASRRANHDRILAGDLDDLINVVGAQDAWE